MGESEESEEAEEAEEAEESGEMGESSKKSIAIFEKYLSLWVLISMIIGTLIGYYASDAAEGIENAQVSQVNIPISILIWIMIFPALLQVDFTALREFTKNPKAVIVTTSVNYLFQPFAMYGYALLFFNVVFKYVIDDQTLQDEFIAGAILLGCGPCTAMVFVWSYLVDGDLSYTLLQTAVNNIILMFAYAPTAGLLIGTTSIDVPWDTILFSLLIFIIIPIVAAGTTRYFVLKYKSQASLDRFTHVAKPFTQMALLLTVMLIFVTQGERMVNDWLYVILIAVPLTLQTITVFLVAYAIMYLLKVEFSQAAPGALIATSNFFELSVAVAITTYGSNSGAVLVNVVGVLTEVPLMLFLVWVCKKTKHHFPSKQVSQESFNENGEEKGNEKENKQSLADNEHLQNEEDYETNDENSNTEKMDEPQQSFAIMQV